METKGLHELYNAAVILTGPSSSSDAQSPDLKSVLHRRLADYRSFIRDEPRLRVESTLEVVQLDTASEALIILELLHRQLTTRETSKQTDTGAPHSAENDPSLVGTRDLALIRTLLSIVFKWAVEPLVQRIVTAIPSTSRSHIIQGARIVDLTGLPHEFSLLSSTASRILALSLSEGITIVTATLLNRHLHDLLLPCIIVGWLPKTLSSESMPTGDALRPQVMHLLAR